MTLQATAFVLNTYPVWKASEQVRQNILAILRARGLHASDLAFTLKKHRSWMSRFLNRQRHELQLRDLDQIAAFFGIATYQLFQPGISEITERRSGRERRQTRDRRISNAQRVVLQRDPVQTAIAAAAQREAEIAARLAKQTDRDPKETRPKERKRR